MRESYLKLFHEEKKNQQLMSTNKAKKLKLWANPVWESPLVIYHEVLRPFKIRAWSFNPSASFHLPKNGPLITQSSFEEASKNI